MAYQKMKIELKKQYGNKCMLCGRKLKNKECTFHHIVPKSKGGTSTIENGSLLCKPCQNIIHIFSYEEDGYRKITNVILTRKRS